MNCLCSSNHLLYCVCVWLVLFVCLSLTKEGRCASSVFNHLMTNPKNLKWAAFTSDSCYVFFSTYYVPNAVQKLKGECPELLYFLL